MASIVAFSQIMEPVKWSFQQQAKSDSIVELIFSATIEDGWHLYGMNLPEDGPIPTAIHFDTTENVDFIDEVFSNSIPIKQFDETFQMELSWFDSKAVFVQKIKTKQEKYNIEGYVEFMACNNQSCLPPTKVFFSFGSKQEILEENGEVFILPEYWQPVISELNAFGETDMNPSSQPWWMIFLKGLLGGLLAILTPCIWPIIPMTISFFLKRSKDKNQGRIDAVFYGFSIVFIYLLLGFVVTLIFGASALNSLSTNAVFNLFFFVLLVTFAISFLGFFEITLPSSWSSRIDSKAEKTTGFISVLLMAFTLVVVSFSCTGPIIGTLLVDVSVNGSVLAPLVGMFGFAVALALPFSLFAFFPTWLNSLPKSGGWLNSVKVVLGFIEVALGLKFLSVADQVYQWNLLDREVYLAIWIVVFSLLGLYLLGKIRFVHDSPVEHLSVKRLFFAIVVFSFVVYMIPGMWGAPLKALSGYLPPVESIDFNLAKQNVVYTQSGSEQHNVYPAKKFTQMGLKHIDGIPGFFDLQEALEYSKKVNKPVFIDYTGAACVNCREMEAVVFSDSKIRELLNNKFVFVSLYGDVKTEVPQEDWVTLPNGKVLKALGKINTNFIMEKYKVNAMPYYIIVDANGNEIVPARGYNLDKEAFEQFLNNAVEVYATL